MMLHPLDAAAESERREGFYEIGAWIVTAWKPKVASLLRRTVMRTSPNKPVQINCKP